MIPEFDNPLNFTPPAEVLEALIHSTDGYHVIIGLDPIGSFHSVSGLTMENPVFTYNELGRNDSAVHLPFDGPLVGGKVKLEWGTIVRNRFWNWFWAQSPYLMEKQPVFIVHLSRRSLPLRVYVLWGAWPSEWSYSDLGNNEISIESVTLHYDRMFLLNPGILMLGKELGMDFDGEIDAATTQERPDLWPEVDPTVVAAATEEEDTTTEDAPAPAPDPEQVWEQPWHWKALEEEEHKTAPYKYAYDPKSYKPSRFNWDAIAQDPKNKGAEWFNTPLEQSLDQTAGVWGTEAIPEDYEGVPGVWQNEALPEDYTAVSGSWELVALPQSDNGGDGESVDEEG